MSNLSFHGQRELSTGLQLQQKDQNHTAITFPQFRTANIQMLRRNCHDREKPIIQSTKL